MPPLRKDTGHPSSAAERTQSAIRACLLCSAGLLLASGLHAQSCEGLRKLHLPDAHVTSANLVRNTAGFRPAGEPLTALPPFCRVALLARPSIDSAIHIEIWLPVTGWNSRLLSEGNGGFAGAIEYRQLSKDLRLGFAAASTDMGTSPAQPTNADVLVEHPEKWADWGYRATHIMSVAAKQVIQAYYGKAPRFSYFRGCSTGGQQGLSEAQRFPEDYDGILSGAPANNRTRLHMAILWTHAALDRGVHAGLTQEKLALVHEQAVRSCQRAALGQIDRQSSNPLICTPDLSKLLCNGEKQTKCLKEGEIGAIQEVYSGPVDAEGHSISPGLAPGSELAWTLPPASGPSDRAPFDSIFKWVFGASWNWHQFDFNRDVAAMDRRLAPVTNATNPNLSTFEHLGHKLLLYHGWADPLVSPQGSIDYFQSVVAADRERSHGAPRASAERTEASVRLFLVHGMQHCGGGLGPNDPDFLPSLQAWVEQGVAPDHIPLAKQTQDPGH